MHPLVLTTLARTHDLAERRHKILHTVQEQRLGLQGQCLGAGHTEQGFPRYVAAALMLPADVQRQETRHIGKLLHRRPRDEVVR